MEEGSGFAGAGSGTGTGEHSSTTTMGRRSPKLPPRARTSPPVAWSNQPAEGGGDLRRCDAGIGENPVQETCAGGGGRGPPPRGRNGGGDRRGQGHDLGAAGEGGGIGRCRIRERGIDFNVRKRSVFSSSLSLSLSLFLLVFAETQVTPTGWDGMSARDFLFRGDLVSPRAAPAQFSASAPAATGRKKMIKIQDEEASSHDFLFAPPFSSSASIGSETCSILLCSQGFPLAVSV
jgi:hypothetical protein